MFERLAQTVHPHVNWEMQSSTNQDPLNLRQDSQLQNDSSPTRKRLYGRLTHSHSGSVLSRTHGVLTVFEGSRLCHATSRVPIFRARGRALPPFLWFPGSLVRSVSPVLCCTGRRAGFPTSFPLERVSRYRDWVCWRRSWIWCGNLPTFICSSASTLIEPPHNVHELVRIAPLVCSSSLSLVVSTILQFVCRL